ncbi:uncharacterized protein LOC118180869, partial [Stegodyphus dumicola]|uniref:uncharacterized protein LOC118180869 n=1 Tax=Stegodyphus dumicola TaxID=202533 RepID=UPI0015AAB4CA
NNFNSVPSSRTETPPSDGSPQTPPAVNAPTSSPSRRNSERRKRGFVRKNTQSAPDSFDNDDAYPASGAPTIIQPSDGNEPSDRASRAAGVSIGYFNFDSMQRLLDLSITAKAEKPAFLLTPGGLTVGKDKAGAYMTLPSPNVQTVDEQDGPPNVFKKLSSQEDEESSEQEDAAHAPPASVLHRRRALVPPKMITDDYESATDDGDPHSPTGTSPTSADDSSKKGRRSSIVVIPPMQICPGDLLVYSKVLSQRNTLLDYDGSTQSLSISDESSRKGKNTWSLLRLFDRSGRSKSESLGGLEEVLSNLRPSEFIDEHLSKYKGMTWSEFVSLWEQRNAKNAKALFRKNSKRQLPSSETKTSTLTRTITRLLSPSETEKEMTQENLVSSFRQGPERAGKWNHRTSLRISKLATMPFATRHSFVTLDICRSCNHISQEPSQGTGDNSCFSTLDEIEHQIQNLGTLTRSRNEQKRREALWDLFQSECMFLYDHLMVLRNVFMEPLKKIQVEGFAMFAEPEVLFGNLDELCVVTYAFCKEFLSLILQKMCGEEIDTTEVLVKLFQKSTKANALTQAYHRYTLNYINALNYLETLRRQVEFNEFEKWCSKDARCKKLQLTDLLVSPVQHVMRVPLILKEIEMRTEDPSEKKQISSIIEAEENSLRELDDKMKWLKNFERLLEIQRSIVWPSVNELDPKAFIPDFLKQPLSKQPCERLIVSPRRQIVLEGALQLLDSGKPTEAFVLLFDDMLLITRRKKGLHKKKSSITENWASTCSNKSTSAHEPGYKYIVYKQPLSLDRFFIHDVTPQDGTVNSLKNAFVLVCLNRFQQIVTVHTFQAPNESVKALWLSKLRDTMDRWKRTLQNTVFRNQRTTSTTSTATIQPPDNITTVK